jgi:hypothetical protein
MMRKLVCTPTAEGRLGGITGRFYRSAGVEMLHCRPVLAGSHAHCISASRAAAAGTEDDGSC